MFSSKKKEHNLRVFAISDLHLSINSNKPMDIFGPVWSNYLGDIFDDWKSKVSDDDVVIMAGDFSWAMKLEETAPDFDLLKDLPGKKIIIRGNHDYWWNAIGKVRNALPHDFYALQNDALKIGNYIFCGTRGWTFDDEKLLARETIRLEMSLQKAKELQTDGEEIIVIMHYPPFEKSGTPTPFTDLIEKYGVKTVVFGHIHGNSSFPLQTLKNDVKYYLTSCDMVSNHIVSIK